MISLIRTYRKTLKGQIVLLMFWFSIGIVLMQAMFVVVFLRSTVESYQILVQTTVSQLSEQLDSLGGRLRDIANLVTFNSTTVQLFSPADLSAKLRILPMTELTIDSIRSSNPSIHAIILTDYELLYLGDATDATFRALAASEASKNVLDTSSGESMYLRIPTDDGSHDQQFLRITRASFDIGRTHYYANIIFSLRELRDSISGAGEAEGTYLVLIGDDKEPVILRQTSDVPPFARIRAHVESSTSDHRIDRTIIYWQTVPEFGWTVTGTIPMAVIWRNVARVQLPNLIILLIIMIFLFFEAWLRIRNITTPIAQVASFIHSVGDTSAVSRLEIVHENEIGQLASDVNTMLDRLDTMNTNVVNAHHQVYLTNLARQEAELAAFQSQVNPHFLYNTLDCIRSMAISQEVPEISQIIESVVHIFRYSVKESAQVRVRDELKCIEHYLTIMQIRHDNRFSIRYDIEEVALDASIPKMVLQPVVENALLHGLERKRGAGSLSIRGRVQSPHLLVLEVEDDGNGMAPKRLAQIQATLGSALDTNDTVGESKSIGLLNIQNRIRLLYGAGFDVDITNGTQGGILVSLKLPYRRVTPASSTP